MRSCAARRRARRSSALAELRLIVWPYDRGLEGGMGSGAARLAEDEELRARLAAAGWEVAEGGFPLVLAGNCVSCLGTAAGVGTRAAVWLDAHADFDTPEDNRSDSFDVMGLAMLTGSGWRALRESIPGFAPLAEHDVVLGAVRDLEPYQRARIEASELRVVTDTLDPHAFAAALAGLGRVYLHLDLDALDADDGRANDYAASGGPSLERLLEAVGTVGERCDVAAAALTSFDVACDPDGRVLAAARALLERIARGAAR